MTGTERYIVVDSSALPDVFRKVLDVKELLAKGSARSSSEACKLVGISRGAYYKYKDRMFYYDERISNENVTFHFVLEDTPGILSSVLACFYTMGANILTVNQNIPNDSVAVVSISVRLPDPFVDREGILDRLSSVKGVVDVKIL